MITGLSGRRALRRVRTEGKRANRGAIRVAYRPAPGDISHVAFAIPRNVGSAVTRNRVRRRIRAILRDVDREVAGLPPSGEYLIRVTDPLDHLSYSELRTTMTALLDHLAGP